MSRDRRLIGTLSVLLVLLMLLGWANHLRNVDMFSNKLENVDNEYPSFWPSEDLNSVIMHPEDTHRYELNTPLGISQWRALIPDAAPNGTIFLGSDDRPFTLAMFHQLQCLDIIRAALVSSDYEVDGPVPVLVNHCMNYLRQATLCHGHLALESVRSDQRPKITDLTRSKYICRDWRAVYEAVGRKL